MQYTIAFEEEPPLFVITFAGTATGEEVMEALQALRAHRQWSAAVPELWDATGVHGAAVAPSEMRALVQAGYELTEQPAGRQAIVVHTVPHRMIALLYKHYMRKRDVEVGVFDDLEAARRWIDEGVEPGSAKPRR